MQLRVCPPMLFAPLKPPPAKILPSACTAIEQTRTVRVRVERISQAGRGIEPGDAVARLSADAVRSVKSPPTKILPSACTAIELDSIVRVRVEGGVERAVRVQPGNVVARDRAPPLGESGKTAADKNLAVRLDDHDETGPLAFGSKPSSADCPRTAAAPPASSTATEKSKRGDFMLLAPYVIQLISFDDVTPVVLSLPWTAPGNAFLCVHRCTVPNRA